MDSHTGRQAPAETLERRGERVFPPEAFLKYVEMRRSERKKSRSFKSTNSFSVKHIGGGLGPLN